MTDSIDRDEQEDAGTEITMREEALLVDAAIMQMLNIRFEVAEDIVKVWPSQVGLPDETNWLIAPRFTQNLDSCREMFSALKVETHLIEDDGEYLVRVKFPLHGGFELDSAKSKSSEMAHAIALMSTLYIFKAEGS